MSPLYRLARRRGLVGGSRAWTTVWLALLAVRLARRFVKGKPEILFTDTLAPGESFLIRNEAPPARPSRR
ncbi:MAG: hypothetical protein AB7H43_04405 [Acidimicrobiia bacterium]